MNPNATPETIAAATRAVEQQTQDTVRDLEEKRAFQRSLKQNAATVADTFRALETTVASGVMIVREVIGADEEDQTRIVTLSLGGEEQTVVLEMFTKDKRLHREGAKFAFDLRSLPDETFDASKSGFSESDPDTAAGMSPKEAHEVKEQLRPAAVRIGDASLDGSRRLAEANKASDTSVLPTTGTTGPQGTNDTEQRSNVAPGGPVNPNDPNATGPSTDAGQATKGEMKDGMQTGGTSGEGTGKGESERAAAREESKE